MRIVTRASLGGLPSLLSVTSRRINTDRLRRIAVHTGFRSFVPKSAICVVMRANAGISFPRICLADDDKSIPGTEECQAKLDAGVESDFVSIIEEEVNDKEEPLQRWKLKPWWDIGIFEEHTEASARVLGLVRFKVSEGDPLFGETLHAIGKTR
ncbi:hypothetical protein FGB62_17g347 [Gracilaria domingensis]|nr:hypothetical protein FGB62_17g347 [Gracilaria domingensis]